MSTIKIESEISGTVWKIEASLGQAMAPEDVILIIESMKMEIPVAAPDAGRLVDLKVAEGDMVSEGQVVAVLER